LRSGFAIAEKQKAPQARRLLLIPAHSASQSNCVGENVKVTNESKIVLCKPLNATEIEVLQHLADGLGTADIAASRSTTAQVIKNYTYRACQSQTWSVTPASIGGVTRRAWNRAEIAASRSTSAQGSLRITRSRRFRCVLLLAYFKQSIFLFVQKANDFSG
jgi:hypothetical protein